MTSAHITESFASCLRCDSGWLLSVAIVSFGSTTALRDRLKTARSNRMDSSSPRHLECQTEGANHSQP